MDFQTILVVAGGAAAAFFGAKAVGGVDNRVEDRRRHAVELAAWAKSNGLGILSELLTNYAVGGYGEVVGNIRQIVGILRDPEEGPATIRRFVKVQLDKQLATEEGKADLVKYVEDKLGVVIDRAAITKKPVALGEAKAEAVA